MHWHKDKATQVVLYLYFLFEFKRNGNIFILPLTKYNLQWDFSGLDQNLAVLQLWSEVANAIWGKVEEFFFLSIFSVPLTGTDDIKLISKTWKKIYIHSNVTIPEVMHEMFSIRYCCRFYDKKLLHIWVDVMIGLLWI